MEIGKVFISSILDPNKEDLRPEREAVRAVVETYRFLRPWAFEKAPAAVEALDESYIRHVEDCDLFIIVIGAKATDPVTAELQRAKDRGRPILLFAKDGDRTPLAKALLDSAGVKYAPFSNIEQLRQCVTVAIDQAVVSGLRSLPLRAGVGSLLAQLRSLAEKGQLVRVRPMVPVEFEQDTFMVNDVKPEVTTLTKIGAGQTVHIPTTRFSDVLFFGHSDKPQLVLEGRLQLISTTDSWKFFDERPDPDSLLGFAKPSSLNDQRVREIQQRQTPRGIKFYWGAMAGIGRYVQDGWQIVYDDDGRYFRIADRTGDLVLLRSHQQALSTAQHG